MSVRPKTRAKLYKNCAGRSGKLMTMHNAG